MILLTIIYPKCQKCKTEKVIIRPFISRNAIPHALEHAMKENAISWMLRDVARRAHAPARHSASHDYEK